MKYENPHKSFEQFRKNERKPLTCVICKKVKVGKFKEDPDSITNSSFVCLDCINWAESVK